LGLVLVARAGPQAAFALAGGALTDRLSPPRILILSNVLRGLLVGALAIAAAREAVGLALLLAISLGLGVAGALFGPASASILPDVVAGSELEAANSLYGISEQVSMTIGPALGGVAVFALGTAFALTVDAATFLLAASLLLSARLPGRARHGAARLHGEIAAGLRYVFRHATLPGVLAVLAANSLAFNAVFLVGIPTLARSRFAPGPIAMGLLWSASGIGQLAGVTAAGLIGLPRRWGLVLIVVAGLDAAVFLLMGWSPLLPLSAIGLGLLGVVGAYADDVMLPVYVQRATARAMLGRTNAAISFVRALTAPISFGTAGVLAARDPALVFYAAAVVMAITAARLALSAGMRALTSPSPEAS